MRAQNQIEHCTKFPNTEFFEHKQFMFNITNLRPGNSHNMVQTVASPKGLSGNICPRDLPWANFPDNS